MLSLIGLLRLGVLRLAHWGLVHHAWLRHLLLIKLVPHGLLLELPWLLVHGLLVHRHGRRRSWGCGSAIVVGRSCGLHFLEGVFRGVGAVSDVMVMVVIASDSSLGCRAADTAEDTADDEEDEGKDSNDDPHDD